MPELPEVENVVRNLQEILQDKKIIDISTSYIKLRKEISTDLPKNLIGKTIRKISRRAKFIVMELTCNNFLIIHLGMSGRLTLESKQYIIKKHDHFIIKFENFNLVYNDARRFGLIEFLPQAIFQNFGIEPLEKEFNADWLFKKLQNKKTAIKLFLMNQAHIVGIGNIYAIEALFKARINPLRPSESLTYNEALNLVESIKETLLTSIAKGGSSLKDYVNIYNQIGSFQNNFNAYQQKECEICASEIIRVKQGGRSTFYCPNCQK